MTADSPAARAEAVRDRCRQVFATVPPGIEARLAVAEATGRLQAVETIEDLRRVLLAGNPLDARTQQLVHFAQLVALGREGPARLHARGARRAGATPADLVGVAETSLVTSGMPAYALAIDIVAELLETPGPADQDGDPAPADQDGDPAGLRGGAAAGEAGQL